jgi:hypothetical protein
MVGRSRQTFIKLHNTSPVSAKWDFRLPSGKDENRFIVTPASGNLRSGAKEVVCVEFLPTEAHKYTLDAVLRVDLNSKSKVLKITGEGVGSVLRFDPGLLDLGTVLPMNPGVERVVTLTSQCDVAVEVFSLDFDRAYLIEEEMLMTLSSSALYDKDGIFRSSVRNAGEALPLIVESSYRRIIEEAARASLRMEDGGDDTDDQEPSVPFNPPPLRIASAPRDESRHQDILVLGPPLSGVSTIAQKLGKKLILTIKTVDDIISEVAQTDGEEGGIARRGLGLSTDVEKNEYKIKLDKANVLSEESKKIQLEAAKKDKKKPKAGEVPVEIPPTPETAAYETLLRDSTFSKDNLTRIFTFRLTWTDCGYGLIIDGCNSQCAKEEDIVSALSASMPRAVVALLRVGGDKEGYLNRLVTLFTGLAKELDRLATSLEKAAFVPPPLENQNNRSGVTIKGSARGKIPSTDRSRVSSVADVDIEIEVSLPIGDETWVDLDSGLVLELNPLDVKSLEAPQKVNSYIYANVLRLLYM